MMRAVDELITLKTKVCRPVRRRLSVIERGDPLWNSLTHKFQTSEKIRATAQKMSQIGILLERQREQILADCQGEIRKHEFQADYDRRSIQKLNEMIESEKEEICGAHQGDERLRRDHQLLHPHHPHLCVGVHRPRLTWFCSVFRHLQFCHDSSSGQRLDLPGQSLAHLNFFVRLLLYLLR